MRKHAKRMIVSVLMPLAALSLSSCALMFDGVSQQVTFTSPQSGSKVTVEGQQYTLPATPTISKKTQTASFSNPKYKNKDLTWQRNFQWGYFWLDFLFTPGYGLSGFLTDGLTGAWMKHPPVIDYNFATGATNVKEVAPKQQ